MFLIKKEKNEIYSLPVKELGINGIKSVSSKLAFRILEKLAINPFYPRELANELKIHKASFEDTLNADYCLSTYNRRESITLSMNYLQNFDAVIWAAGKDIINIDEDDALVLREYVQNGGSVILEGADIAFKHTEDDFMKHVAHATLARDLIFDDLEISAVSVEAARNHPILQDISCQF